MRLTVTALGRILLDVRILDEPDSEPPGADATVERAEDLFGFAPDDRGR